MLEDARSASPNVRVNPATVQNLPLTSHLRGFAEMIASDYLENYMAMIPERRRKGASSQRRPTSMAPPQWSERVLDFTLRLGMEAPLCPCRP
jgi:hypothetical protein